MRARTPGWLARLMGPPAVAATVAMAAACGVDPPVTTTAVKAATPSCVWSAPNADIASTRHVCGPINSATVGKLGVAWSVPIKAPVNAQRWPGVYVTTPVVAGGVVYTQDLDSNVYAIDLRTGRELWIAMYNSTSIGPNGVAVAGGKVFGATATSAFALDASTGKQLWSRRLVRNKYEGIDMQPGVNHGTVYISTVPGNAQYYLAGEGQGVLWALDGDTGQVKWKFDTVPASLWGNPAINSGGGLWYPPSFDSEGNVYADVANPIPFIGTAQYPWGSSRPGPDLYTDSLVKLDASTGKIIWYKQVIPHDIYDWDLMDSPVMAMADGDQVVLASGKMGYIYEFDRATGKLLWKTPVGVHDGHDNDDILAMNGDYSKLPKFPYTVAPGVLGGINAPMATDGTTVYAAVNSYPGTWVSQEPPPHVPAQSTGELDAINIVTGKVKWTHKFDQTPYGAASVTNDLVFTTTFDGVIHALDTRTGQEVWSSALPAVSNSPVAISGSYVIAADGWPQQSGQQARIIAYHLTQGNEP